MAVEPEQSTPGKMQQIAEREAAVIVAAATVVMVHHLLLPIRLTHKAAMRVALRGPVAVVVVVVQDATNHLTQ